MQFLKLFFNPPPPSERETFVAAIDLMIQKKNLLSTLKGDCENYLFLFFFFWFLEKKRETEREKVAKCFHFF